MLLPAHTHRIFVAVNVPIETYSLLDNLKENYPQPSSFKWMRPQNLHLTIYFIGTIESTNFDRIVEKVKIITSSTSPFALKFDKLALMPSNKPTMLWAKYETEEAFTTLYHQLHKALQPFSSSNFSVYENPTPHITLARFNGMKEIPQTVSINSQLPHISINSIYIWETESKNGQSDYIQYPLKFDLSGRIQN